MHERDEALEQLAATAEILQVIRASPTDVQPVFETIVRNAVSLCGSLFANVFRFDGELLHFVAAHNVGRNYVDLLQAKYPMQPDASQISGRVLLTKSVVRLQDALTDPDYDQRFPSAMGWRRMLGVPMLCEGDPLGVIVVGWAEAGPVPKAQEELLKTFADQAVIAIENARVLHELRQRTDDLTESLEQQTATSEVLQVISSSPGDLEPVFKAMLENAVRICDAKFGLLFQWEGGAFRTVALHGVPQALADERRRDPVLQPTPGTALERAAAMKQTVQIADVQADAAYQGDPVRRAGIIGAGGARTLIAVPMLKDNELVGAITIYRQELRLFTDKQVELVKNFAAQAVIAIENTRLLTELRQRTDDLSESLEQQTATSEVLKVISSSPGELEPVFNAMLENATRICEAKFGNMYLREGDMFRLAASHNTPPAFLEQRARTAYHAEGNIPPARMLRTRSVVHIADLASDETYLSHNPHVMAAVELGGIRTLLIVPLIKESEVVGSFNIFRQEVRPFTEKQIDLLKNFAAQAVIAIENTRLLSELRESLQQQTATADVLKVISRSTFDLQTVLNTLSESVARLCEAYDAVLFLRQGEKLHVKAHYGPINLSFTDFPINPNWVTGRAFINRVPLHVHDLSTSEEFPDGRRVALVEGHRTLLSVPLLRENEAIGAIAIRRRQVKPFTDKQIELVKTFADQAVIAIENVRLFDEVQTRTRELAQSVSELQALGEVGQAVNSTLDLETVLTTIVSRAVQLSRTDAGAIYVFDEGRKEFRLHATFGMSETMIAAISDQHIGFDDGNNIATATTRRKPVQVADTHDEPASAVNAIVLSEGYRSLLIIPLLRPDHIVGALVVRRKTPGEFLQSTIDLLQTFADQSVVAIQNARLYENVEARTRELAALLEDLRTTQDRLVQTQKLASLGQLTAGIAHEIKNPLNFVNNFSGVSVELIDELQATLGTMKADDKTAAEISELADTLRSNLDKIVQHGKRADSIVKNMLLHSREGSGEHRPVDINTLVEESLNLAYHGARAEKQGFNITLERSLDPAAGEVDVFPQDITRVLLNLISNGFYAATKRSAQANGGNYEPTLAAATKNLGDCVEIRIRDNGTGIPPDVKEKMFNPFYTTKPAGEGTGLGLSISHDIIVKQHGGSIEVDTRPGEFTEIKIILPRVAAILAESEGRA